MASMAQRYAAVALFESYFNMVQLRICSCVLSRKRGGCTGMGTVRVESHGWGVSWSNLGHCMDTCQNQQAKHFGVVEEILLKKGVGRNGR